MKHNFGGECMKVRLCPLMQGDIENLRVWRNDTSQTQC